MSRIWALASRLSELVESHGGQPARVPQAWTNTPRPEPWRRRASVAARQALLDTRPIVNAYLTHGRGVLLCGAAPRTGDLVDGARAVGATDQRGQPRARAR